MIEYYKEALKAGKKEYKKSISEGNYPYLSSLDVILPDIDKKTGQDLGLIDVPANLIVGTRTDGRTTSFARNFMPIMKEETEFATKWKRLCNAHLNEGIHDAVKVYEYMNRYYVQEGNKRVSVLKYFKSVTIPAMVTRILPERNEETECYYALVDFQKATGIYFIEFSQKERYAELLKLIGKDPEEKWTEDERRSFAAAYYFFLRFYETGSASKTETLPADAMLAYIKVFGYESLKEKRSSVLKKNLSSMTEEIKLMKEDSPLEIKTQPEDEKKPGIIKQILNTTIAKEKQIAFIHDKTRESSGWTNAHEMGRLHVARVFEDKIRTQAYFNGMDENPDEVISRAIADGNEIIFTTSPRFLNAALAAAVAHPEVAILNCSLNKPHRYIRTYYARMYEAKFIAGAIAGTLSDSGRVGYVCNYPIFGQIAGINAFALGLQMVNPKGKVYLEWSGKNGVQKAVQNLMDQGIHLISSIEAVPLNEEDYNFYGLFRVTSEKKTSLAVPIWAWGKYYEKIIAQILDGTFKQEYQSSDKAINYYWGMSAGVVDILTSPTIPEGSKKLALFLKEGIKSGSCTPFMGPIYTQSGDKISTDELPVALEQIVSMDYLVENVIGDIPVYEELNPVAKSTVEVAGVGKAVSRK